MIVANNSSPLFSIITVVFNDLEGFKLTESSVKFQQCQDFEWLVIDGGSTDGLPDYLEASSIANKYISEKDNGIYDAMNKGVNIAKGEYILFLNAGDGFVANDSLTKVASILLDTKNRIDVLFCGANLLFNKDKLYYRKTRKIEKYIWHGLPANHQATFYRTGLLGQKPYSDEYKLSGDYYIVAKLYQPNLSCKYLEQPVVFFRIGGFSYQHPVLAIREAYRIQRDILHTSFLLRLASMLRRIAANMYMYILQNK